MEHRNKQLPLLAALSADAKRAWSAKDLSEATRIPVKSVANTLAALIAKGYVSRLACPTCKHSNSYVFKVSRKAISMGAFGVPAEVSK